MHTPKPGFRAFTRIVLLSVALTLPACQFFSPPAHPVKKVKKLKTAKKTQYQAEAYIKHLALARIAMSNESADYADAAPSLEVMDDYSAQKRTKADTQVVLVIEYERKNGDGKQILLAPIRLGDKADTPGLLAVMNALTLTPSTLHDLRIRTVTISGEPMGELSELGSSQIRQILERKQQELQASEQTPPVLERARTHLALAQFFLANRFRDAAYLAADNTKKQLAAASSNSENEAVIKVLSEKLEAFEADLHKEMPFSIIK